MPGDPQTTESPLWHEALRQSDQEAHRGEDEWMRLNAVRALELRLAQANADRHALRAAVRLRNDILEEQRLALAERDGVIADLLLQGGQVGAGVPEEDRDAVAALQVQVRFLHEELALPLPLRLARKVVRRVDSKVRG